jgi:BirA family transcriptional regulator, biotin operon repressor / biotin---[acetyl-CoA-carboxylase] ligase
MISKDNVLKGLRTQVIGKKLFVFESIDSTNTCVKTLAEVGNPEGTVVVADFQTAGRGRLGRSWVSEPGANLLFSLLLRPPINKEAAGQLTFYSAVFIARALERVAKQPFECKWPNDVLLEGKKCCGILLENSIQRDKIEFSVVGIGINVNQSSFPEEMSSRATSLYKELGHTFDRTSLLQEMLREADTLLPCLHTGEMSKIMEEWNSRCTMFGKPVTLAHGEERISGTAVGLDADGGLIIKTQRGQATYYAGDVTLLSEN